MSQCCVWPTVIMLSTFYLLGASYLGFVVLINRWSVVRTVCALLWHVCAGLLSEGWRLGVKVGLSAAILWVILIYHLQDRVIFVYNEIINFYIFFGRHHCNCIIPNYLRIFPFWLFSQFPWYCLCFRVYVIERRGRVVDTPASNSGGLKFESRPGDRLCRLRFFVVFLSPSRWMQA
jgi:hypothetical protein